MALNPQKSEGRDRARSTLDIAIEALKLASELAGATPVKPIFGSVCSLLTMIRDSMANKQDFIGLGLHCGEVCKALERGLDGRPLDELSQRKQEAIHQLNTTVEAIRQQVIKQRKQNVISRLFLAKACKDAVAAWRQELDGILQIFNTQMSTNTNVLVSEMHQSMVTGQSSRASGELPPPAPRTCFGRDQLIEDLVGFAESLEPVALIGAGGIGKTAIALTVLHHDRIKMRFDNDRRFIRCDQFPPSRLHFLARLSKVIGAGIKNPEDLTTLRPFLISKKMVIVLDNVESVLDPHGADAQGINAVIDELCQFENIWVVITSRLTTVPRHCKRPEIPTLSLDAACDIFYSIHGEGRRSDIINNLLQRLDFHALSITLLATTASHNMWDYGELVKEWEMHRAQVIRTDYNESLAATIELSLASPTFRKLGDNARDLLGVVAFFPQGVQESKLDSFFPTVPDRGNIFNRFRVLSLAHRSNGFITMLAPIRDYLCPKDPVSSPLLCATKDCYFNWLSVKVDPDKPGFEEAKWIQSEDVNVEHLLNVFTTIDTNSGDIWDVCAQFMGHLYWHQKRETVLGPKIQGLPDNHPSKAECLFGLARLFQSVGKYTEEKRLLFEVVRLERERGNDEQVALMLGWLSDTNRLLNLPEEGIQQAKEAIEIAKRLGSTTDQARYLMSLAYLCYWDKQLDAAEEAVTLAIKLFPQTGMEFRVCRAHRILGDIHLSKGEREKAIHQLKAALGIASTFHWRSQLFSVNFSLAKLFLKEDKFADAQAHIEQAKLHAGEGTYDLSLAMMTQCAVWHRQCRLDDARIEALGALEIIEKLGAAAPVRWAAEYPGVYQWILDQKLGNKDVPGTRL